MKNVLVVVIGLITRVGHEMAERYRDHHEPLLPPSEEKVIFTAEEFSRGSAKHPGREHAYKAETTFSGYGRTHGHRRVNPVGSAVTAARRRANQPGHRR